MAVLKFYLDNETGIYGAIRDTLQTAYEKSGKTWTNQTGNKLKKQAIAILTNRYQVKLDEMIHSFIAENFPRIPQEFSVSIRYEIASWLTVLVESEAWNEQLTDRGWDDLKTGLFVFLHNTTTWIEGSRDWKRWQRNMMQEEIERIREENA